MKESHKTKSFFGLSLSGSLGLVDRTWKHEVRRSHFPHDEMDTVPNSQVRQRTVMASGALSATEGGQLHHTATENRTDCDHGRHRPATETLTHTKKLSQFVSHCNSRREAAGRRTRGGLLKFVDSSSTTTWKGSLTPVPHSIGRRCRHWPRRWLYTSDKRQVP